MAPNREKERMHESDGISTKKNARLRRAATQNKARSKKAKRGDDEGKNWKLEFNVPISIFNKYLLRLL